MSKTKRPKPLYQRGEFRLDRRPGRANLVITYYDSARKRERGVSAGSSDLETARRALDALYIQHTRGAVICPTCGQPRDGGHGLMLLDAIANYQTEIGDSRASAKAIAARLAHVVSYIETTANPAILCDAVDEQWIEGFRAWAIQQPIISPKGAERPRAPSTVENSVLQLAAAINRARARGDTLRPAQFRPIPPQEVNRTPYYRADVATLARMFAWAADPKWKRRKALLAFLRISVVTLARPDAAHDVSTAPERGQWIADRRILNLNPQGRRQTRKFRAIVPVGRHVAPLLDACAGFFVPVASVKKAFASMAKELGLPGERESGMKLVRRSMANLLRDPQYGVPLEELEMMLGHRRIDSVSELYAPFDPAYLARAKAAIETICDQIESHAPGAFYRDVTAIGGNVSSIARGKNGTFQ